MKILGIGNAIVDVICKVDDNFIIQGRDFVIATVAAPTIVKEPEKPAEAEGEAVEGAEATTADGENKTPEGEDKTAETDKSKKEDDKSSGEKNNKS